jgi:hypothetical protein
VEKSDSFSLRSNTRRLIDQLDPPRTAASEGAVQILDGEADVMYAWSATVDESRDRGVGGVRLEQLDERIAGRKAGDVSTVRILERMIVEAKEISIERKKLVDRANGDSNVRDARSTTSGGWHENRAPYLV